MQNVYTWVTKAIVKYFMSYSNQQKISVIWFEEGGKYLVTVALLLKGVCVHICVT